MKREMLSGLLRRVGLWVSGWIECRLSKWPRDRLRWLLIALGALGTALCAWMLGSSMYNLLNHH